MSQESGKALNVLQKTKKLIQKQQNMTKLSHETWNDKLQTFVKSSLPEEPLLKLRMCVDISSYAKHDPPLQCTVQKKWLNNLVGKNQKDIVLKTTTADTGAQCFLLGRDHLPGLGLGVEGRI